MMITIGAVFVEFAVILSLHNLFYGGRLKGAWGAAVLCLVGLGLIVFGVNLAGA